VPVSAQELLEKAFAVWPGDGDIDEQWSVFHTELLDASL